MGQRGILRTFLTSVLVASVVFFVIYFFIPSMSMQYLGISYSLRDGSVNSLTLSTIRQEFGEIQFSKESGEQLWKEMNSREFRQRFKLAGEQGEQAIKALVNDLVERVR